MSRGGRGANGPQGGGYDHYRSDNYLGSSDHGHGGAGDHYSKNGVILDSGSNHGIRYNAGAAARNRLEVLESERNKNLALIKGNG